MPIPVCVSDHENELEPLASKLSKIVFGGSLAGRFTFATTADATDLTGIDGYDNQQGYLLIEPDDYGTNGKLVAAIPSNAEVAEVEKKLSEYVSNRTKSVTKNHHQHVRAGKRDGKAWKTEIPVTDAQALRAMDRR